jgi:hypothetical protein
MILMLKCRCHTDADDQRENADNVLFPPSISGIPETLDAGMPIPVAFGLNANALLYAVTLKPIAQMASVTRTRLL